MVFPNSASTMGGMHFCIDYWKLENISKKDCYPLSHTRISWTHCLKLSDFLQWIWRTNIGKWVFIKKKRKRHGFFKFKGMLLELCSSPTIFERLLDPVSYTHLDVYKRQV